MKSQNIEELLTHTGKVEPGIPSFSLPPFQVEYNNQTIGFVQMCTELGSGIVVVPLVAVLANVAIAKAFSKWHRFVRFLQTYNV